MLVGELLVEAVRVFVWSISYFSESSLNSDAVSVLSFALFQKKDSGRLPSYRALQRQTWRSVQEHRRTLWRIDAFSLAIGI